MKRPPSNPAAARGKQPAAPPPQREVASVELPPEVRAELLDPESWGKVLELYARSMRLAVALIDPRGNLVGECHNPQPIWSLARAAKSEWGRGCLFCLDPSGRCAAASDALRTASVVLVHDQGGLTHVAAALSLHGLHVGTLLAGQVFDRYPEPLPLQRVAREYGLSAQQVWHSAREQAPISRTSLTVYGDLLSTLGQAFLKERYSAILERRLAETNRKFNEDLETANSELRNLIDSAEIATIFLDSEWRLKKFTPAVGSLLQLTDGDIGRPLVDLEERFAEAGLLEPITEVVRTLSIGAWQEYPLVRARDLTGAHGQHYMMRVLPYRASERVVDGVVMTFVNVTELKEAEQLAAQARIYSENIVETVREPLLVLDEDLRVRSANSAFFEKFQVGVEDTAGRIVFELGNRQWDIPELRRLLSEVLPRDQWVEDFQMEHDFLHLGPRTMVLNARRIDHVQLILLAIEDITERKRAENGMRTLNLNLKHFSYAASHDLQEPLRMVKIYTQLIARRYKGKLDPEADQFIARTLDGAQQMETLLRDLREYWLANELRLERRAAIDCGRVLEKAIQVLQVPISESHAEIIHEPLPTIMSEDVSLAMLFQNLLSNAIKYQRPGEQPSVHVSARKMGTMWCFQVQDNGIGIEAKHLEEIFAPFKRLHGTEYPGSGLGLAICQKIVERHGGRLWVESAYGQGSTFFFTIPA